MEKFSHYSPDGKSQMVDVTDKKVTSRTARAYGRVYMKKETLDLINKELLPKGDVFEVARVAGIMAAKRTGDMIPMCHPLLLTYVNVNLKICAEENAIEIFSDIKLEGKTGAEMEALTAVSFAALTVYDMCKAVDKEIRIGDIHLIEKKGGKSDWNKEDK
ncbi:MAG TPA: cyclic pyranopterin monophosphate synthase MoaC [Spirochaetota bacterium]|nr:cyclic pyranopterin monophosphate synthase MoaC [Spirochaetota bacterium]